jgi:hypothetical protein
VSLGANGGQGVPVDGERVGVEGVGVLALPLVSVADRTDQLDAVSVSRIENRVGGDVGGVGHVLGRGEIALGQ